MGNMSRQIDGLLKFGVPYISEADGTTPMQHAVEFHDEDSVNVFVNYLANDACQLEVFDIMHIIENFNPTWKNNFIF